MAADLIKMPKAPAAQLRAEMRRRGVRNAARAFGITENDALRIAGSQVARRSAIVKLLQMVTDQARGGRR